MRRLSTRTFLLLALFIFGACAQAFAAEPAIQTPAAASGSGFEGRVVINGAVIPGARVYAYKTFADFTASKPLAISLVTGDDGKYRLDLAPGSYYMVAKKRQGEGIDGPVAVGEYFSFQGSNPITVSPGKYIHVGFSMLPYDKGVAYEAYDDAAAGGLTGVVTLDGKPLAGAYVTLYVDTAEDLRGSTYASSPPTGADGTFRFDFLPEVEYFVVARKRAAGGVAGPLTDGDYFGFFPANPVTAKSGKLARIEIPVVTKAGEIGMEDSLFRDTGTKVTGVILDKEGKPPQGVYVFAYLEKVMAHKRPEFISKVVDKDGRYVLNLPQGGTYYLGARSQYGDTPALGEWYGRWEGTGDHSVKLKTGETLQNIDMTVEQILP